MLRRRVIPSLLLRGETLVKTTRFRQPAYIGDPVNTVRIFNELEVDELAFLDIEASRLQRPPNFSMLASIADECFMPLSYGGGIRSVAHAERIFELGFEKVIVNSVLFDEPDLVDRLAQRFGKQSVIVAVDVSMGMFGGYRVTGLSGTRKTRVAPLDWAKEMEARGAGEILLTSIDREGSWKGFDLELTAEVCGGVSIPVIAHGGAGTIRHIGEAIAACGASAVALGSMVVYQGRGLGVLVNFPDRARLREVLS